MTTETPAASTAPQTPPTLEGMALPGGCYIGKFIGLWCVYDDRHQRVCTLQNEEAARDLTAALSRSAAVAHGVPAGFGRDMAALEQTMRDLLVSDGDREQLRAVVRAILAPDAQAGAVGDGVAFDPEAPDFDPPTPALMQGAALLRTLAASGAAPAGGLPGVFKTDWNLGKAPTGQDVRDAVEWLANRALGMDFWAWGERSNVLLADADLLDHAAAGTGDAGRDHLAGVGKMVEAEAGEAIRISYINWRAEQTTPRILPQRIVWGSNEWHPEPGWLLKAVDLDKVAVRTYALRKILAWDIATPAAAPAQGPAADGELREASFQARVKPWVVACFGDEVACDVLERQDRFVEEALELVQSLGYDRKRVAALTDYVFDREPGDPHQEIGGTQMTLAALCNAIGHDMHEAGEAELARVWGDVDKIRAKQAAKPKGSALPVALAPPSADRDGTKCKAPGGACLYRGRCNTNRFGCHDSEAPATPEVRR